MNPNELATAVQMYQAAIRSGATPNNALFLVGAAYQESGFNPQQTGSDSGTSFGLMQVGSRLWNQMQQAGVANNPVAQMGYYINYLQQNQPRTWDAMQSANSVQGAYQALNSNPGWALGRQTGVMSPVYANQLSQALGSDQSLGTPPTGAPADWQLGQPNTGDFGAATLPPISDAYSLYQSYGTGYPLPTIAGTSFPIQDFSGQANIGGNNIPNFGGDFGLGASLPPSPDYLPSSMLINPGYASQNTGGTNISNFGGDLGIGGYLPPASDVFLPSYGTGYPDFWGAPSGTPVPSWAEPSPIPYQNSGTSAFSEPSPIPGSNESYQPNVGGNDIANFGGDLSLGQPLPSSNWATLGTPGSYPQQQPSYQPPYDPSLGSVGQPGGVPTVQGTIVGDNGMYYRFDPATGTYQSTGIPASGSGAYGSGATGGFGVGAGSQYGVTASGFSTGYTPFGGGGVGPQFSGGGFVDTSTPAGLSHGGADPSSGGSGGWVPPSAAAAFKFDAPGGSGKYATAQARHGGG